MKVENLETAERFAKKRRTLSELAEVLSRYVHCAEVKVTATVGNKVKETSIREETFNALLYKLVEDEINNIDKFVESL